MKSKYVAGARTNIRNQGWKEGETYGVINKGQIFFKSWEIGRWNSLCLTVSYGALNIFMNGERQTLTSVPDIMIGEENLKVFGFPVIGGQPRDEVSEWKYFPGKVTDLNTWTRVLSSTELAAFADCQQVEPPDLLAWPTVTWAGSGIEEEVGQTESLCEVGHMILASTVKRTFDEGLSYCRNVLAGELAVTEDSEAVSAMVAALQTVPDWKAKCFYKFYTGYVREREDTAFTNPNNKQTVANLTWLEGQPLYIDEDRLCPHYDIRQGGGSLNKECFHTKCPLCKVRKGSKYHLRGVCNIQTWRVDINYVLTQQGTFIGKILLKYL